MSQHTLKCTPDSFAAAFCEIEYQFETGHMPDVKIGDLIKMLAVKVENNEESILSEPLMREVAQVRQVYHGEWKTKLTLVPLDHPMMRQIQLTNPSVGTFVCWVGSRDVIEVGSSIRLVGDSTWWTVQFACTHLPVRALPKEARIGFLSEVCV